MAERRKYTRVNVSVALDEVMEMSALTMREPGKVVNLSIGGFGVISEGLYQMGSMLSFGFTLPNGKALMNVRGKVVRVGKEEQGWYHGVVFEGLGWKNWLTLKWFLFTHK